VPCEGSTADVSRPDAASELDPTWFEAQGDSPEIIRVADETIVDLFFAPNGETYESLQPYIRAENIDGVTVRVLSMDELLRKKRVIAKRMAWTAACSRSSRNNTKRPELLVPAAGDRDRSRGRASRRLHFRHSLSRNARELCGSTKTGNGYRREMRPTRQPKGLHP